MKPYPQMTVDEFGMYISDVMDEFPHEDYYIIFMRLINDDVSDDKEMKSLLIEDEVNGILADKLILIRNYFWDLRYSRILTE